MRVIRLRIRSWVVKGVVVQGMGRREWVLRRLVYMSQRY